MKADFQSLTLKQRAEIRRLSRFPESGIDTSDIPEIRDWSGAKRAVFVSLALRRNAHRRKRVRGNRADTVR
jgi:hypothetical protein